MSCIVPYMIEESSLEGCTEIGAGGFGKIYKARHREWACDVAIKLLYREDGKSASLMREIDMMRLGSSPHVIQVRGVFKGRLPTSPPTTQLGLVMEYMERGSLAFLQETLDGAPPWPLVFRLAHQVALGINFLHSLPTPMLHLDLKPSNVLLDCALNAKLTDFGLSQFSHSIMRDSDSEVEGGTTKYMPPEAFDLSYKPTQSFDIYSYGILLWSIATGKQPYPSKTSSLVKLRISDGDRPLPNEIRGEAAGLEGLKELMQKCWDQTPKKRPSAHNCTIDSEKLYKMHKRAINDDVHQVLKKLDQREERLIEELEKFHITKASGSQRFEEVNACENVPTGGPPIQEMARASNQRVKDSHSSRPSSMCYDDVSRPLTESKVKGSSVCPIVSSPPSPSTGRSSQSRTEKPSLKSFSQNPALQYQRQSSSPVAFPSYPPPGIQIHCSNVTGFQQGNNNTMHIQTTTDRKRHPTAPPRIDLMSPQTGSKRDKTGGVG
ncbi:receptor-interacting serine/threonine-protein kinase 3 [Cottoperca gobio]|uniref:Receptor-interacting serine/threonine-protein kinase 3-like n=1 Tax=Cottoperca gobio TaxID=56716 RepID=A0A6J2RMH5_COTGO|nr:receptor-interacting serine/threonine-protein kinase 3-like [Cottoperca gobio]XP_029310687.1 receptor-interacting serine/threonine-protein kinase 3-like [Cottoperca gobio]